MRKIHKLRQVTTLLISLLLAVMLVVAFSRGRNSSDDGHGHQENTTKVMEQTDQHDH